MGEAEESGEEIVAETAPNRAALTQTGHAPLPDLLYPDLFYIVDGGRLERMPTFANPTKAMGKAMAEAEAEYDALLTLGKGPNDKNKRRRDNVSNVRSMRSWLKLAVPSQVM
jgi:hypothetical protein